MSISFSNRISVALENKRKLAEEKRLIEKIEKGFLNHEFKMYLQLIVDGKTKEIVMAEALSRWQTSCGEFVMPGKYIGVMEKYGLITKLDYYMFEKVCAKLCEWDKTEHSDITISCNFTRLTISEPDFVTVIKGIAEKYSFERKKLHMEITEDAAEKNHEVALDNVRMVKELGFSVALDDIGSGCTSLINLCEYPIDTVKIDRDILLMTDTEKGKRLFSGIVALSHSLKLAVVCEGVETEEQNELALKSGCDFIQGWYYSKALPDAEAESFVKEYTKKLKVN